MSTLLQLRVRASQRLNQTLVSSDVPAASVLWTRSEMNQWANEACEAIWSEIVESGGAPALVTVTDGTYTASTLRMSLQTLLGVTDDPLEILEVRDVTNASATGLGLTLTYKPHGNFNTGVSNDVDAALAYRNNATRRLWTWSGSNPMRIELCPVPTTALTLRVRYVPAVPATLALDADVPSWLPTAHHNLIVQYIVVQAKQKEDSDFRPDWALYQEKLQRLLESIEDRQQQSSRGIYITDPSEYGGP